MENLIASASNTKSIIQKYNFLFKKGFGQNFIVNSDIVYCAVEAAQIDSDDCVLEIGPGIGSLTQILAKNAKKVIAVEIDRRLIPILNETLSDYKNVEIINEDILKLNLDEIVNSRNDGKPIKIVANLPYYITTPIIMSILENKISAKSITVMTQKEVAERMQAVPSTKDYGALSVAVQYYCKPEVVKYVSAHCFIPQPKVDSCIIKLNILDRPIVNTVDEKFMFKFIKIAFSQRRKTIVNCIENSKQFDISKSQIEQILTNSNLDIKVRGESLTLLQFAELANLLYPFQKLV